MYRVMNGFHELFMIRQYKKSYGQLDTQDSFYLL